MRKSLVIVLILVLSLFLISCEDNKDEVKLLYSESNNTLTSLEGCFLKDYEEYELLNLDLGLDEDFFTDKGLYVYLFMNNNLGKDIYKFKSYQLKTRVLEITCYENDNILVSPAFGTYAMIFEISKDLYESINVVAVKGLVGMGNTYKVIIKDSNNFIINNIKSKYSSGDVIVVRTEILTDVSVALYVNDEFHSLGTAISENGEYVYWEYYIIMPNKDISITLKLEDGFLSKPEELETITFADDSYQYHSVNTFNEKLDDYKEYLKSEYVINDETLVYAIDTNDKYQDIFEIISGDKAIYINDDYRYLLVRRKAQSSSFIKANYSYTNSSIMIEYPYKDKPGNDAIFICYDFVRVSLDVFNEYVNETITLEIK